MANANNKFYEQATHEYDPQYNSKINALKNQLAENVQAQQNQKAGINSNYDTMVQQQNLNNNVSKNNISNAALGRGLSRSSIVTSGMSQADMANQRQVGYINNQRLGDLNNIEGNIAMLNNNFNGSLATLQGNRESEIMALARQLEDRDWDKQFNQRGQDMQNDMNLWTKEYQGKQLSMTDEMNKWTKEYQGKQLNMEDEMNKWTKQYQQMTHDLGVRAQAAQEKYQQAQIGLQRAANAAQASYWNRQMAMAEKEFNAAQAEKQKEGMKFNEQIGYLAQLQEISKSENLTNDQKKEWYGLFKENTSGSLNSYADNLLNQLAKSSANSLPEGMLPANPLDVIRQQRITNLTTTPKQRGKMVY